MKTQTGDARYAERSHILDNGASMHLYFLGNIGRLKATKYAYNRLDWFHSAPSIPPAG